MYLSLPKIYVTWPPVSEAFCSRVLREYWALRPWQVTGVWGQLHTENRHLPSKTRDRRERYQRREDEEKVYAATGQP